MENQRPDYLQIFLWIYPLICLFCSTDIIAGQEKTSGPEKLIELIILDPGHGHATFMQGSMNPLVSRVVHVYAPEGPDVQLYLNSIDRLNSRQNNPTSWQIVLYTGIDYLEKMVQEKKGNTVVISGNNQKKSDYIRRSVEAGFHVLADKPMAITPADFKALERSFGIAGQNKILLFDNMDLRYDISNILQKELSQMEDLFGKLQAGSVDKPSLIQANLHHYLKFSGGQPIVRPAWFFDTEQQGHGIVDVSTHLIDLNQWLGLPGLSLNYREDIKIISSKEWPTRLNPSEFRSVTHTDAYPDFLSKNLKDSILEVYSNGEINYTIKGIHSRITVLWKYKEPAGSSDTHYSLMRGTKAELEIRQEKEEGYRATLYIRAAEGTDPDLFGKNLQTALTRLRGKYPGTELIRNGNEWQVKPGEYTRTNAAQIAISYLTEDAMPDWEVPGMRAKYYTTTEALRKAARE